MKLSTRTKDLSMVKTFILLTISVSLILGLMMPIAPPSLVTFFQLMCLSVLVYVNIEVLIPKRLKKLSWYQYLFSALSFLVMFSSCKIIALYFLYHDQTQQQELIIQDQALYYLIDFSTLAISTLFSLSFDWLAQQRKLSILEREQFQTEIKFLKAQINPHFLFNTLNNIYALTLTKDDMAPDAILKLSNILRYILYESNDKEVPVEREWSYILDYISLEKLRVSSEFQLNIDARIENEEFKIAPLVMMTFVENAFKHSLSTRNSRAYIDINLLVRNDELIFGIKNSYSPSNSKKDEQSSGIGLQNATKRLKLMYANRYNLDISGENKIYSVNLQINKND